MRLNLPSSWSTLRGLSSSIELNDFDENHSDDKVSYIDHPIVGSWRIISYNKYDLEGNKMLDMMEWMLEEEWVNQEELDLPLTFDSDGTSHGNSWWHILMMY